MVIMKEECAWTLGFALSLYTPAWERERERGCVCVCVCMSDVDIEDMAWTQSVYQVTRRRSNGREYGVITDLAN